MSAFNRAGGRGGGYLWKFYTGRLRPEVQPLTLLYRVFSLRWPASMQIYWNKRKCLHKKRVQLLEDWFGTPTWPLFHCFGTPIWPPWRHVKTLYSIFDREVTTFVYFLLSIDKWCSFYIPGGYSNRLLHIPSLELSIPFHCCKCSVFKIWINNKTRNFFWSSLSKP